MADTGEDTRLDQLWRAVARSDAEADWLRFYEGFAAARLIVPLAERAQGQQARLKTFALDSGEVALAFDTEARFAAFIKEPTDYLVLAGAMLAKSLAPQGISVALNPMVSAAETVLDPKMLGWIADHAGAEVTAGEAASPDEVAAPADPDPELLDALGRRLDEMSGSVAEAWLLSVKASRDCDAFLFVIRLVETAEALADDVAKELTRLGQIRAARPFGVAVVRDGAQMLRAARQYGIGLALQPPAEPGDRGA